ncbi:MAG TPA: hypothetical protein VF789_06355 [Thermoanaerobaculia bacterium]
MPCLRPFGTLGREGSLFLALKRQALCLCPRGADKLSGFRSGGEWAPFAAPALLVVQVGNPPGEHARPLFEQFWDDLTQLRLHWVEGKIADRLGKYDEAESILVQLWDEFRARDLSQEVVLVTIDLAQVLVRKGELARAARLAAESYSILRNWGLRQDALAAWMVFQEALAQGKLAGDLFERMGGYFRRHWFTAGRFEP